MALKRVVNKLAWSKNFLDSHEGTKVEPIRVLDSDFKENILRIESKTKRIDTNEAGKESDNDDDGKESESSLCLWPFFVFARLLGMCTVSKERGEIIIKPRNPYWIFTAIAVVVQVTMIASVFRSFIPQYKTHSASEKNVFLARKFNDFIYYSHCLGNCLFMIWRVDQLPIFLRACKQVEFILKKYHSENDRLVRHVILTFSFFLTSHLLGNVLYYNSVVLKSNVTSFATFFKEFDYDPDGDNRSANWGAFFCLAEFYCDLGWIFGDILLTLFSMILTRYFLRLNKVITQRGQMKTEVLDEIRADHREIAHLVDLCNRIFSPLFLLTYVANVGYLLARLYVGVNEDFKNPTFWVKAEGAYAFGFQIMKIMFPTWVASALNEQGSAALHFVHSWPSFVDSEKFHNNFRVLVIGRFVSQLINNPVGISGCGYFLVTKNFLVALISALVTYEVVILQFQQSGIK